MRSIPIVMTWELLHRGRWSMLLAVLGANLLPLLILTALRFDGPIDPEEPAFVTLQMTLLPCHLFCFAAAILSAQDFTSRAYTLPVPASTLVAWRMIPAMILAALETLLSTVFVNTAFGLNWPLWGPTLLAPVALAMVQATLWYSMNSSLLPVCICFTGTILGLWFKSRWGSVFSLPQHAWTAITPLEVGTMLFFVIASYFVAIAGIRRGRCGDPLWSSGMFDWLQVFNLRLENVGPLMAGKSDSATGNKFRSPAQAQFWFEWRMKGWLLPGIVVFGGLVGVGIWVVFSRDPLKLVEAMIGSGAVLSIVGLMGGLIMGNCGNKDSNVAIGHFLATRPLTNRDLAASILRSVAWSVLISWAIWAISAVSIAGLMAITGTLPQAPVISQWHWWYLPGALLSCWIAASVTASFLMIGRDKQLATFFCASLVCFVGFLLATKLLDRPTQEWVFSALQVVAGIGFGLFAAGVMIVARRRLLIESSVVALLGSIWAAVSAIIFVECLRIPSVTLPITILLIGVAALGVAPFAAAPLAIGWNRHR